MTHPRTKIISASVVTAVSVFAAGAAAAKPWAHPTHTQFITEADQICGTYQRRAAPLESTIQRLGDPKTSAQVATLAKTMVRTATLSRAEVKALSALPEPSADRSDLSKIWAVHLRGDDDLTNLAKALNSGNSSRVASETEAFAADGASGERLMRGYGLKVCGKD